MRYVVAYDIASDQRRAKVAARLSAWGDRVEKSVFECSLSDEELEALVARLQGLLDLDKDVLHIFRQCATCGGERVVLGNEEAPVAVRYWIV